MLNKAAIPQPDPVEGKEDVYELLYKDFEARRKMGIEKYGTSLMTHNGRHPLWDALQETLDEAVYLRQAISEWDDMVKQIAELKAKLKEYEISA